MRDERSDSRTLGWSSQIESTRGFHPRIVSDATLWIVPNRWAERDVVVLHFDATLVEAAHVVDRISAMRAMIQELSDRGKAVVPVFSASHRGPHFELGSYLNALTRSSPYPATVSNLLRGYREQIQSFGNAAGLDEFHRQLQEIHLELIAALQLDADKFLRDQMTEDLALLCNTAAQCCSAYEDVRSLHDDIVTAGERMLVRILAAYFNQLYNQGQFSLRAEPVTARELGLTTTDEFGEAEILWPSAILNAREAVFGRYLDRQILPIVTAGDGVFDPTDEIQRASMAKTYAGPRPRRSDVTFRTSLGRDGGDVTASFLGVALGAEYVGFCRDTPGIPSWNPQTSDCPTQAIPQLDYDLATEAGIFGPRTTEPARAASLPLHVIDVRDPKVRTVISDAVVRPGTFIWEHPAPTANLQIGCVPRACTASEALGGLLDVFAENEVDVEEIRHQRSATECIVRGKEANVRRAIQGLSNHGLRVSSQFSWYLRVVGNVDDTITKEFNAVLRKHEAFTFTDYQPGTRVLSATLSRNRAIAETEELERIRNILLEFARRCFRASGDGLAGRQSSRPTKRAT